MLVVGSPIGGFPGETIGYRPTLGIASARFLVVGITRELSQFRNARIGSASLSDPDEC